MTMEKVGLTHAGDLRRVQKIYTDGNAVEARLIK